MITLYGAPQNAAWLLANCPLNPPTVHAVSSITVESHWPAVTLRFVPVSVPSLVSGPGGITQEFA